MIDFIVILLLKSHSNLRLQCCHTLQPQLSIIGLCALS